jgi:hypothetical protein
MDRVIFGRSNSAGMLMMELTHEMKSMQIKNHSQLTAAQFRSPIEDFVCKKTYHAIIKTKKATR